MAPNFEILLKLGILFLFLLGRVQGKEEDEDKKPAQKSTPPYLDSRGNLCQDRMELVQDTEYETMIQCRVAMTKSCEDNTIDDTITKSEEACHTVYEKECKTVYRPHRSKVRVRICPNGKVNRARSPFSPINKLEDDQNDNSIVLDVRPNPRLTSPPQIKKQCHNGKRMVCTTKYHTECTTQQIQQTMEEDHPKCQVEMVEKCPEDSNRKKSACTKVPAMRCRIEKRTVVKTKPESKCSRIPRQLCRKEDCDDVLEDLNVQDFDQAASESRDELLNGDADCYYRNQVVNEIVPEEKCSLIPKTMCHTVNKTNGQSAAEAVNSSADLVDQSDVTLRRTKRSARDHWAFLRRHYLSRAESPLQRMSRNFEERQKSRNDRQKSAATSAALKKHHPPVFCKMVPEQKCEKKRVNPRRVEKEMKKTFCREPRKNSIFDQLLMAKLTHPEFSEFNP